MDSIDFKARVILVNDVVKVTDTFSKREMIVEEDWESDYKNTFKVEATQSKVDILDDIKAGDIVTVSVNLKGREWTKEGKTSYFTSLNIWKVTKEVSGTASTDPAGNDLPF